MAEHYTEATLQVRRLLGEKAGYLDDKRRLEKLQADLEAREADISRREAVPDQMVNKLEYMIRALDDGIRGYLSSQGFECMDKLALQAEREWRTSDALARQGTPRSFRYHMTRIHAANQLDDLQRYDAYCVMFHEYYAVPLESVNDLLMNRLLIMPSDHPMHTPRWRQGFGERVVRVKLGDLFSAPKRIGCCNQFPISAQTFREIKRRALAHEEIARQKALCQRDDILQASEALSGEDLIRVLRQKIEVLSARVSWLRKKLHIFAFGRFKCTYCAREFGDSGRWQSRHTVLTTQSYESSVDELQNGWPRINEARGYGRDNHVTNHNLVMAPENEQPKTFPWSGLRYNK